MELRQLQYFIGVAEELSFTRAAERLRVAQPALSRQIRQLEDEIGLQLFARNHRTVNLTPEGSVFLEEARAVLERVERAADVVRRTRRGEYGRVRIGIASGVAARVHAVTEAHGKKFPNVELECRDFVSTEQTDALLSRHIDVGFLRPPIDTAHLVSEPIYREPFLVYLSLSNPLARRTKIRLKDIADEQLVLIDRSVSSGVYDKVLALYRERGIAPRVIQPKTGPYQEAGALLIASGKALYVGVGAVLSHPVAGSGIAAVRLDEPDAEIEVHVAWRKQERSQTVLAFLETVRQVFGRFQTSRKKGAS